MVMEGKIFSLATPYIKFSYMTHKDWEGLTTEELYESSEKLRKAVKKAIDYHWDNSHFEIKNIYGRTVLSVGFFKDSVIFWNAITGDGLFSIQNKIRKEDVNRITKAINQVTKGKRLCHDCKKWVKEGENYSFTGFVCKTCYNPEVHLPPDPS